MKSLRLMQFVVVVMSAVVLISLSTVGLAQSDAQKSDAQKSFDKLKTLAGSWEGHVTTVRRNLTSKASSCRPRFA